MVESTLQACFYPRFGIDKPDKAGIVIEPPRAPLQSGDFIQKIAASTGEIGSNSWMA